MSRSIFNKYSITKPQLALAVLCAYAVFYGALGAYQMSVITNLEKRFEIETERTGWVVSSFEIGGLLATLGFSYLGSKKPRLTLVISAVGITTASVVFIIPFFIYGPKFTKTELLGVAKKTTTDDANLTTVLNLCNSSGTNAEKSEGNSGEKKLSQTEADVGFGMMMLSGIIAGIFGSPFWTIGVPFIDNIAGDRSSGLYISVLYALRSVSPICGNLFGSFTVTRHETLQFGLEDFVGGQKDPRWIGAWWLGFVVFGIGVILTIPFIALINPKTASPPRSSQNGPTEGREMTTATASQERNGEDDIKEEENAPDLSVKEMFVIIFRLLATPVFLWLVIGSIFHIITFMAYFSYLTKYLEYGFLMVPSHANKLTGFLVISTVIAVICSGLIDRRWSMTTRSMCLFNACVTFGILAIVPIFFIFSCPTGEIRGLGRSGPNLTCLPEGTCNCSNYYRPVCVNDITYFSACHAGCTHSITGNGSYLGCLCKPELTARPGACLAMCWQAWPFSALLFVIMYLNGLSSIQYTKIVMRQTSPSTKPVALGCISFIFLIIGIAVPPALGKLIDITCLLRQPGAKNCLHYDGPGLGRLINTMSIVAMIPAFLCQLTAWYLCPRTKAVEEGEADPSTRL